MTKEINLHGIKCDGFPPKKLSFAPSFIFLKKFFSKKYNQNALNIIGVLLKDASIRIDIVPQLKHTGCHAFLQ